MKSGGNWVGGRDETGGRDVKVWLWMLLEWRLEPGPWQPKNKPLSPKFGRALPLALPK